jgi:hypothetical protein
MTPPPRSEFTLTCEAGATQVCNDALLHGGYGYCGIIRIISYDKHRPPTHGPQQLWS